MKFKKLSEGISQATKNKKIETTKAKISKLEVQIQKAQKNLNNLDAKIEKDIIKPASLFGLSKDFVMSKFFDKSNGLIYNGEKVLKFAYKLTNLNDYGITLNDVLNNKTFENDFDCEYFPDKTMYRTVGAQYLLDCFLYRNEKLKKYKNAYHALYIAQVFDYEKYDRVKLQKDLDKKQAELEKLNIELESLKNFETKEERTTKGLSSGIYAKIEVQKEVLEKVYKTVTDYYNKGLKYLTNVVKEYKKHYEAIDNEKFKEAIIVYNKGTKKPYDEEYLKKMLDMSFKVDVHQGYYDNYSLSVNGFINFDNISNSALMAFCETISLYKKAKIELAQFESIYDTEEKRRKIAKDIAEDLFVRVYNVAGTMIDASDLKLNSKGGLDGIVIGEKSKALVKTIGAGGYNIQRYHYRTIIHKI